MQRGLHLRRIKHWIINKNIDEIWERWKSLFIQVLDKHAPLKAKRVRKKGSVPWINKDIKAKLFESDFLKRKAIG
jgi:hypothetical protein